jgi:hypothetical protein
VHLGLSSVPLLAIFPANGIDQSLHAPVLIGLFVLTFFRESLGWGYAGLVVPGYLATVFLAAPLTGALMLAEGFAGYFLAAAVGRVIPRSKAWSELFGRERFLLIILCALLTRLGMEAYWVPRLVERYGLSHSRELYSIGLVLVPLLSNAFWNAGIGVSLPRLALITAVTFVFVDRVLLAHTNFTLARFQIANESVSLAFLETPHAYVILVLGAVLAARDNVLYGWDYNGILVPALLAVAWYEPGKLLTTMVEALVVLFLAKRLSLVKPFSAVLMVGSRRMLMAYGVGFVVKWLLGFVALEFLPNLQTIDYFGFGYLLPSLLAIKMWNTDKIGRVLMPTLQVSLVAFLLGNATSIGLNVIDPPRTAAARGADVARGKSLAVELMLGDTAPAPREERVPWGERTAAQDVLALCEEIGGLTQASGALKTAFSPKLRVARVPSGGFAITPRSLDPNEDFRTPRLWLSPRASSIPTLVVVDSPAVGSPHIVIAGALSERIRARAVVIRSRLPALRALDDAFIATLSEQQGIEQVLVVGEGEGRAALSVVGVVPSGLPLAELESSFGFDLEVRFRSLDPAGTPLANRARFSLSPADAGRAAASILGAPPLDVWPEPLRTALGDRVRGLTSVLPGSFEQPSVEALRLFAAGPLARAALRGAEPAPFERALAAVLGYRFARVGAPGAAPEAYALFEPESELRRGQATLVVRAAPNASKPRLVVELPAPRYERGAFDAALSLVEALPADAVLLAGALPNQAPDQTADSRRAGGRKLHYQAFHEVWLQAGGHALSVHGLAPDREHPSDAIVAFQRPSASPMSGPAFSQPIARLLRDNGFSLGVVDGRPELEAYSGALDPPMAYARRFAGDQMMLLFLTETARAAFASPRSDLTTEARVVRAGFEPRPVSVAAEGQRLVTCLRSDRTRAECGARPSFAQCDTEAVIAGFDRYNELKNPLELRRALSLGERCGLEVLRDVASGQLWTSLRTSDAVYLVPFRPGPPRPRGTPREDDLGRAVALGLSSLRLGAR